jgi:hypothetical protein
MERERCPTCGQPMGQWKATRICGVRSLSVRAISGRSRGVWFGTESVQIQTVTARMTHSKGARNEREDE